MNRTHRFHSSGPLLSPLLASAIVLLSLGPSRAAAAAGTLSCSGTACSTSPQPLPDNFLARTTWNPCSGGPFRYYGAIHFEAGYDYVAIDGHRFEGYNVPVGGLAAGPVSVEVSTDSSVQSRGLQSLDAECLASNTACAGTSCNTAAQPTLTMQTYAAECDRQIGVSVPAFSCDDGTVIPGQTVDANGKCENPSIIRAGAACLPGSTLKRLYEDDDVVIAAVCRKGIGIGFEDIAIIQHNRDNGATCFYQRKDRTPVIPDPSVSNLGWESPNTATVMDGCPSCHDSGALIRTPFIKSVLGPDEIHAVQDPTLNAPGSPYWTVASYYSNQGYTHVSIDAGSACTSCHRVGALANKTGNLAEWHVNSTSGSVHMGEFTVRPLSYLQTQPTPVYTKITPDSQYRWWMPQGRTSYDQNILGHNGQQWEAEFDKLVNCKNRFVTANEAKPTATQGVVMINDAACKTALTTGVRNKPGLRAPDTNRDYQIRNAYDGYSYLYAWDTVGTSFWGAYLTQGYWQFEPSATGNYRIRNSDTGQYLCHVSNSAGESLTTCITPTSGGTDWVLEYSPHGHREYRIASKAFPNKYLYVDSTQTLRFGPAPASPFGDVVVHGTALNNRG